MTDRVGILFFDMNSFFASVAQAEEPALMGRPIGVLTADAPGAACIAASIEAKRRGVKMGTRQEEARQLCPGIVFRAVKHDVCVRYHHAVRQAVETVLPIDRAWSVDEFSCTLMGSQQELPAAQALGRRLQAAILAQVSPALRCSVGLAPNKMLAKVAAALEKPGGLHWLLPHVMPDKIAHLALDDLPGISTAMKVRLEAAGIRDIRQLYGTDPKEARAIWHSVAGERFVRELRGEVAVWPDTQRGMFGHAQVLTGANRNPEGARLVARRLLVKAAARLRREGYFARSLSVGVKCARHGRQGQDGGIKATQDTFFLLETFGRYWDKLQVATPLAVHVTLGDLVAVDSHVPDLFETRLAGKPNPREALCGLIDQINRKFGQDTVRFGPLPRHRVAYTGAKIAFGRIPVWQDFLE
ncbi:MAG: type VI secretion protein ImpB [Paracoccaceae bacterium]